MINRSEITSDMNLFYSRAEAGVFASKTGMHCRIDQVQVILDDATENELIERKDYLIDSFAERKIEIERYNNAQHAEKMLEYYLNIYENSKDAWVVNILCTKEEWTKYIEEGIDYGGLYDDEINGWTLIGKNDAVIIRERHADANS